jgi:hypothetical protein
MVKFSTTAIFEDFVAFIPGETQKSGKVDGIPVSLVAWDFFEPG